MKIIITAEPEDMEAVMRLVLDRRPMFENRNPRLGWGWHFAIPGGKQFFLREIVGGISASPAKGRP